MTSIIFFKPSIYLFRIKDLEESIENLKTQLSKETKERDLQIDFLHKELKKNVNLEYIRNILINFLTNKDYTVSLKFFLYLNDLGPRKTFACDCNYTSVFRY